MHRTISEKENVMRVMTRSELPEWIPIGPDAIRLVVPGPMMERPNFGESGEDWFGCSWVWDPSCFGFAPDLHKPYLLDDVCNWRDVVVFPDLDAIDWDAAAAAELADYDPDAQALRLFIEAGPLERSHHLLGFENAFAAMAEEPEEYKALVNAIGDYKIDLLNHLLPAYKPDDVFFHDDLGTARGPMISMEMYRDILKPVHKRIGDCITSHGAIYNHHSCGYSQPFLEDLYECGARGLNTIQSMNDRHAIAKQFAGRAYFEVMVDAVNRGTEEDIVNEIHDIIDTFGPTGNVIIGTVASDASRMAYGDFAHEEAVKYGWEFYH